MTKSCIASFIFTLYATAALAGTTLIRHESGFLRDSSFQLNSGWLVHTTSHIQYQTYGFYETSGGTWKELNLAIAPIFKIPRASLFLPVGLRFHPFENWLMSHAITKANLFGRAGDFPFFLINDLSWAVGGRGKNEHFIQQQLAWMPSSSRIGIGIQTEQVLAGSQAVSTKFGPVLKLTYAKSANWAWTVDIVPFYDTTKKGTGVKVNLLTFHFGS